MKGIESRITNESFLKNTPEAVVAKEKQLLAALEQELNSLQEKIRELESLIK